MASKAIRKFPRSAFLLAEKKRKLTTVASGILYLASSLTPVPMPAQQITMLVQVAFRIAKRSLSKVISKQKSIQYHLSKNTCVGIAIVDPS